MAGTWIPGEPETTPYDDGLDRNDLDTANSTEGDSNFTTAGFYPGIVVGWESNYTVCDRSGFRLDEHQIYTNWDGLVTRPQSRDFRHWLLNVRAKTPDYTHGSVNPEEAVDDINYIED